MRMAVIFFALRDPVVQVRTPVFVEDYISDKAHLGVIFDTVDNSSGMHEPFRMYRPKQWNLQKELFAGAWAYDQDYFDTTYPEYVVIKPRLGLQGRGVRVVSKEQLRKMINSPRTAHDYLSYCVMQEYIEPERTRANIAHSIRVRATFAIHDGDGQNEILDFGAYKRVGTKPIKKRSDRILNAVVNKATGAAPHALSDGTLYDMKRMIEEFANSDLDKLLAHAFIHYANNDDDYYLKPFDAINMVSKKPNVVKQVINDISILNDPSIYVTAVKSLKSEGGLKVDEFSPEEFFFEWFYRRGYDLSESQYMEFINLLCSINRVGWWSTVDLAVIVKFLEFVYERMSKSYIKLLEYLFDLYQESNSGTYLIAFVTLFNCIYKDKVANGSEEAQRQFADFFQLHRPLLYDMAEILNNDPNSILMREHMHEIKIFKNLVTHSIPHFIL